MSDLITLEMLDKDGAVQEAANAVNPAGESTRADFFKTAAIGGGALIAGGVVFGGLPALALGAPSKKQDVAILNYALTLEFLETAFYKEARAKAGLKGETAQFAKVAGAHEAAHVKALQGVLRARPSSRPGSTSAAPPPASPPSRRPRWRSRTLACRHTPVRAPA